MGFLPLRIDGATSSFKAPLVVLQDQTGNWPDPDKKKATQITGAIVNLLGSYLKSWLLKCHAYQCDFLTTSSPAEGEVRSIEVTAAGRESAHRVW